MRPLYYSLIAILLLSFTLSIGAQDCLMTAANANSILTEAQNFLTAGDFAAANERIETAQATIANCLTQTAQAPVVENSAATPNPTTATTAPTSAGDYQILAPSVNPDQAVTFIAFSHSSVDVTNLDFYLGSSSEPLVSNIAFGEVTPLIPINGGQLTFHAREAGSGANGTVLFSLRWDFVGNSTWIVVAMGLAEKLAFTVEPISITRNDYNNQARIRVVNLAPDGRRSTITTNTGTTLGENLAWVGIRDSFLEAGTYSLSASTNQGETATPIDLTIEANKTYTLIVMGNGASQALRIVPIIVSQDMSRVRFVSSRGAAVDIHSRPGNARLIENLSPQMTTDWYAIPSGSVTFVAYVPNTGPTGQEQAALPIQLRPGRDYTITLSNNGMQVSSTELNPNP